MLPRHKQNINQSFTGMNNGENDSFSSQTSSNSSNYQMQYQNKTSSDGDTSLQKSNSSSARYPRQQVPTQQPLYASKSYHAVPPNANNRPFPQILDQRSKSFNYGQYTSHQNQNFNPLSGNVPILQKKPSGNSVTDQITNQSWQKQQANAPSKYPTQNSTYKTANAKQAFQNQQQFQQRNHYIQENGKKPLMRSQTTVNRNMQKYEITIDLNDYGVKTNNSMMNTYQQQQQYNKSLKMTTNLKNMLFYGPYKYQSLVYVGQNPALKNYLKLRRLKHEELILKKTSNESVGLDSNDENMSSDGFIKINISGNKRLDNPEEYFQLNKKEVKPSTTGNSKNPKVNEKGSSGFKKMFKLFRNNSNDSKKSNKRPATLSNTPHLVISLPEEESDSIGLSVPGGSPSPTKYSSLSQPPQKKLLHNSVTSNSSEKGLDLLLDTVLKAYDGDSDNESESMLYHSPASFSPPALSHLNAFMSLSDGFNMNRRDSINSSNSNNSSSRNSIRSLSYTNLQKLRLLQNEGETEKDKILERLFTAFTEVRIFDEPRKKWIVYKGKNREGRAKLANVVDLETEGHGKKSLNFSNKVEVFQLPNNSDDSAVDGDSENEESEDNEEELMSLTEEELLKFKSMKELEIFQQIKTEINDFKSFEMLVHKDSILNTHFFM